MGKSERYLKKLKPGETEIERLFEGFDELREILKDVSTIEEGQAYNLKNNKSLIRLYDLLDGYNIKHPNPKLIRKDGDKEFCVKIATLTMELSNKNKKKREENMKKKGNNNSEDYYWKNHKNKPRNVYGLDGINKSLRSVYFNRGHLIADSIIKYTDCFKNYSWENFVMITDWCNRANTEINEKKAFGMFHFEEMVLGALEEGDSIIYSVTPVFKKISENGQSNGVEVYELLPRGIIMEAKIKGEENTLFNVFVPNAQKGLEINYATGRVVKV